MGEHDRAHAQALAAAFGAMLWSSRDEREAFPLVCARWLVDSDEPLPELRVHELQGSKTAGKLALLIDGTTLARADLVRRQIAVRANLLPETKLRDRVAALASAQHIVAARPRLDAVLVGDGWPHVPNQWPMAPLLGFPHSQGLRCFISHGGAGRPLKLVDDKAGLLERARTRQRLKVEDWG